MPHDHVGNTLKVGDSVVLPGVVTGIDRHSDYINLAIETRWPMLPGNNNTPVIVNSTQVLLVQCQDHEVDQVPVIDVIRANIEKADREYHESR